jgi:hypothetical protein
MSATKGTVMKPQDIQPAADVVRWLRHYVEWNDEASRDMALAAIDVLTRDGFDKPADTNDNRTR